MPMNNAILTLGFTAYGTGIVGVYLLQVQSLQPTGWFEYGFAGITILGGGLIIKLLWNKLDKKEELIQENSTQFIRLAQKFADAQNEKAKLIEAQTKVLTELKVAVESRTLTELTEKIDTFIHKTEDSNRG